MKPIEELKETTNLIVLGRFQSELMPDAEMWHGVVKWPDFGGTVVWGYNEAGIMEHVSASSYKRSKTPTWEQMCRLKDMFWRPEDLVVQLHPPESRYVHGAGFGSRRLENVLHLWRPKSGDFSELNHMERWD